MGDEKSEILGSDVIVLIFSMESDFTNCSMRILERLDFLRDAM